MHPKHSHGQYDNEVPKHPCPFFVLGFVSLSTATPSPPRNPVSKQISPTQSSFHFNVREQYIDHSYLSVRDVFGIPFSNFEACCSKVNEASSPDKVDFTIVDEL